MQLAERRCKVEPHKTSINCAERQVKAEAKVLQIFTRFDFPFTSDGFAARRAAGAAIRKRRYPLRVAK